MKNFLIIGILLCSSVAFSTTVDQSVVIEKTDLVFDSGVTATPITLTVIDSVDFGLSSVATLSTFNYEFDFSYGVGTTPVVVDTYKCSIVASNKGSPNKF